MEDKRVLLDEDTPTLEICVSCGKETEVDIRTHIDFRVGYIEGVGQLCLDCFKKYS